MKCVFRIVLTIVVLSLVSRAFAALVYLEEWNDSLNGWQTYTNYMTLSHDSSVGNPPGSLRGTFSEQTIPMSEWDAFTAGTEASGGAFVGNYIEDFNGLFWGWRFTFYAADTIPSELSIRFGSASAEFMYNLLPLVTETGRWYEMAVTVTNTFGWYGPMSEWDATLQNVSYVKIQVGRAGTQEQRYYIDNFENVAIPEPATLWLLALSLGVIAYWRRTRLTVCQP